MHACCDIPADALPCTFSEEGMFELTPRLEALKQRARERPFREQRRELAAPDWFKTPAYTALPAARQIACATRLVCEAQAPLLYPDERIVFTRTVGKQLPGGGSAGNICAGWEMALAQGLLGRREVAVASRARYAADLEAAAFLDACIETIDAVLALAARYAAEARRQGMTEVAGILDHVPARPPRGFHEALQSFKMLHSALWLSGATHVTLGRFDQILWPYLQADLEAGRLTEAAAAELLAEFFISLNKDSDLYPGVQLGDNGQALMLGGVTRDGKDAINPLTRMVLRVSYAVNMIDPKINLRITPDTDLELLTEAARLTRRGLGFPQYSNDEQVIPGLIAYGYAPEDARDYTVAACWEFIIPGRAMDIPNIHALSFPAAADQAIHEGLAAGEAFPAILGRARQNIAGQVNRYVEDAKKWGRCPSPFYSVLMYDCLETGRDVSFGGVRYRNFGIHGAGSANAADALAAVRQFVFEEKSVAPGELLAALNADFAGHDDLRRRLQEDAPKVGNHDDTADDLLKRLFDDFADACAAIKDNGYGGIVRAGTGTAMFYFWLARSPWPGMLEPETGTTADGRKKGDFFASSLAPAPGVTVRGPFSVLQSFAKIDYRRVCNGGPITMELADTVFRDTDSLRKVALLIRGFAKLGCQQLQLNTLNVATLRDAQAHPEKHRNLIVRVWGWSGYFCELEAPYQEHIIHRHVFAA